ncbi:hypothetical protein GQ42DRAFT_5563 [Ramicandelaber brevisporus]|nr:hypothetical protein GQ42DRAFT_5563 [Ramicandelaber brevisporus]
MPETAAKRPDDHLAWANDGSTRSAVDTPGLGRRRGAQAATTQPLLHSSAKKIHEDDSRLTSAAAKRVGALAAGSTKGSSSTKGRRHPGEYTDEQMLEIRANERTFDGAYWRTALSALSAGAVVLRVFDDDFNHIGMVFLGLAAVVMAIGLVRRLKYRGDLDPHRPFVTAGNYVLMMSAACGAAQAALLVLVLLMET